MLDRRLFLGGSAAIAAAAQAPWRSFAQEEAAADLRPMTGNMVPIAREEHLARIARAQALKRNATPAQAREIDLAVHRLTAPDQMGSLFKAMALTDPAVPAPAGFER